MEFWWGRGLAHQVPALAFYLVLSLAPLALGLTAVASLLLGDHLHSDEVASQLSQFFPVEIRQQIIKVGENTQHASPQLLAIALAAMLWVLSGALGVLERAMQIFSPVPPFSFVWGKVRLLLLSALLAVIVLVGLIASILASGASKDIADLLSINSRALSFSLTLLTLSGTVSSLALLYKFLPRQRPSFRVAARAALPASAVLLMTPYIVGRYFAVSSGTFSSATGVFLSLAVIMASCMLMANGLVLGAGLAAKNDAEN